MEQWIQSVQTAINSKSAHDLISRCFVLPPLNDNFISAFEQQQQQIQTLLPAQSSNQSQIIEQALQSNQDARNFAKMCDSYVDLFRTSSSGNTGFGLVIPASTSTMPTGIRSSVDIVAVFERFLPIALGFNYAFDEYWLVPVAKHIYRTLVWLAFKADTILRSEGRPPGKIKAACIPLDALRGKMIDRSPFPNTKKAGIIFVSNLIFKCYLKLNNLSQLRKVLDYVFNHVFQQDDTVLTMEFTKSERITFFYYVGKFHLLQHNVPKAIEYLSDAFKHSKVTQAHKNTRLILIYLVTAKLIMAQYPSTNLPLLQKYNLHEIFSPLIRSVKYGHFSLFERHLQENKRFFIQHHIYNVLTWRCPLQIYRNLCKRVFIIASTLENCATFGYQTQQQMQSFGSSMTLDQDASVAGVTGAMSMSVPGKPHRIAFQDIFIGLLVSGNSDAQDLRSENKDIGNNNLNEDSQMNFIFSVLCRLAEAGFIKGNVSPTSNLMVVSKKLAFPVPSGVLYRLAEKEGWWRPKGDSRQIVEEDDD